MRQLSINPRWRLQLEGADRDIDMLERMLMGSVLSSDDFMIARLNGVVVLNKLEMGPPSSDDDGPAEEPEGPTYYDRVPVLTTTKWDVFPTMDEVVAKATPQLKILTGCLKLTAFCGPISFGTIYEVIPGGGGFIARRDTRLTYRVYPVEHEIPPPLEFKRILTRCDSDESLTTLLSLQAEEDDWFTIYKMIEAIEDCLGGETAMKNCPYLDGIELKRAKQTANSYRHLDSNKHRLPAEPMALDEASALLRRSTNALIKRVGTSGKSTLGASSQT